MGGEEEVKKILGLTIAVVLVIGLVAGGTWAYFSDTEDTGDNVFQAGTIDLTLGESAGAPINLTNMKPGDTASGTITVENVGTLDGSLYASSWYVENDGATNPTDMTADEFAKMLLITAFTADGNDMLSAIPEVDNNAGKSVYDMVNDTGVSLTDYSDPTGGHGWFSYDADMIVNESHVYVLTLQFDINANNDYQGDGITWTFEFLLTQQ